MRISVLISLTMLVAVSARRAEACNAPTCGGPIFWPREVPANVPELHIDYPYYAYPTGLPQASLLDATGATIDAGFDGHSLHLTQPLTPGTYGVRFADSGRCNGFANAQELTVTASAPIPTEALGAATVSAAWQGHTEVYSSCDGCSAPVMAVSRAVTIQLPSTWRAWAEVTEVLVEIDGQQWVTGSDRLARRRALWQEVDVERNGVIELRPFARCQPTEGVSADTNGLVQGAHSGVVKARVRGTQAWVSSDVFQFELQCAAVCLQQNELCAFPDPLCAGTTFDAGVQPEPMVVDAVPANVFRPEERRGCSAAPFSLLVALAMVLIRRTRP